MSPRSCWRGSSWPGHGSHPNLAWLCYGLHEQVVEQLGIVPSRWGLLADLAQAQSVASWANENRGTASGPPLDVTWLPLLIAAC